MKIINSTIARATEIARAKNVVVTPANCLEFFKLALIEEVNLAADAVYDCAHKFGKGYEIMKATEISVYATLRNTG